MDLKSIDDSSRDDTCGAPNTSSLCISIWKSAADDGQAQRKHPKAGRKVQIQTGEQQPQVAWGTRTRAHLGER
jgi:hypothetical protein